MSVLRVISKYIVGLVFTFSGFVKCVDPLGTAHKFHDYFVDAFGLESLLWLTLPAAVFMCALELSIGLMLIFNIKIPWASWLALLFMAAFTPLTLYLAIANPVSDCGCFGDALIMTNWQTFFKNIVIDIFVIILFINRNKYTELFGKKYRILAVGATFALVIGFEIFSLNHIPIIDFRPYHVGANIPEGMIIPDDAELDVYETTLIYKKDGVTKEFTIDNYPQEGWEFVDSENKLIKKGYEPPIHDFSINIDGEDLTDVVLADEDYVFLLISYDLKKASRRNLDKINNIAIEAMGRDLEFICLTNTIEPDVIQNFRQETGAQYLFGFTDQTTLKTIVRSNPGLVLLKKGTILDKWHHRHLPDVDELMERLESTSY